ncbi:hypothetical protein [Bacillus phage vB_BanS-Thrax5]|nr:hypothetical protein [Bacillus phage vB_BanS-Thrax5]
MTLFFVDYELDALYIHMLDIKNGEYKLAYKIKIDAEHSIRDAVYEVIIRAIRKKPNQVIFNTTGFGMGHKDFFHKILSEVDFIKLDEKGNMKYVQYMSQEHMELIVKGMRVSEEKN